MTNRVELRHLAALVAVVDAGSYRGAAARLRYSQASVTAQVAALERRLGHRVLDRPGGPRPATLTPAGREVLAAAREVLARVDVLEARLDAMRSGRWGRLAIGTFQSVSATILPTALAEVRAAAPAVRVEVVESESNEVLVEALLSGRLDATFLVGPVLDERLRVVEVCRDDFVAVVAAGDALAANALTLSDLGARPLVGHAGCACHAIVERAFAAAGITPEFVFRSNDNSAVQAMVRAGLGTAVMPRLAVQAQDPGVRLVPIEPALPERSILLALPRKAPSPTALELADRVLRPRP